MFWSDWPQAVERRRWSNHMFFIIVFVPRAYDNNRGRGSVWLAIGRWYGGEVMMDGGTRTHTGTRTVCVYCFPLFRAHGRRRRAYTDLYPKRNNNCSCSCVLCDDCFFSINLIFIFFPYAYYAYNILSLLLCVTV